VIVYLLRVITIVDHAFDDRTGSHLSNFIADCTPFTVGIGVRSVYLAINTAYVDRRSIRSMIAVDSVPSSFDF
jgi:hypothetical protein